MQRTLRHRDRRWLVSVLVTWDSEPVSSAKQISVVTTGGQQPLPQAGRTAWRFAAAVSCASVLGIGLAYCACILLIPIWGLDGRAASLLPTDVVCSSGNSSTAPQTIRGDE